MKKIMYVMFFLPLLTACYGVNEETTEIGVLNTDCLNSKEWRELKLNHSSERISDSIFLSKIDEIKSMHHKTEILYFADSPRELIAISTDHYFVRYAYNPEISSRILNGLSGGLSDKDKKRITRRVQKLIMKCQCEEGEKKSLKLMAD